MEQGRQHFPRHSNDDRWWTFFKCGYSRSLYGALAAVIVAVISIASMLLMHDDARTNTYSLAWQPFTASEDPLEGHLLELVHPQHDVVVYISHEQIPDSHTYKIGSGWELRERSENEIWNPLTCFTLPTVINTEGDIFMLDTYRDEEGNYQSRLIYYDAIRSAVRELDIDNIQYHRQSLFGNTNGQPYFFEQDDESLYVYTVAYRSDPATVERIRMLKLDTGENTLIKRTPQGMPVVEHYTEDNHAEPTRYLYADGALESYNGEVLGHEWNVHENDTGHLIHDLGNDVQAVYMKSEPGIDRVVYNGDMILKFDKRFGLESYAIGSFSTEHMNEL